MPRTGFTQKFLTALYHSQEQPEVFVIMAEISHPSLVTPLRFCNQRESVISNGVTYAARSITFALPNEYGDQAPSVSLTVNNKDHEISLACLPCATDTPFSITIKLALKSTLDTIEFTAAFEAPEDAHADHEVSVFSGSINHGLDQIYPMHAMTPYSHRGLFGSSA